MDKIIKTGKNAGATHYATMADGKTPQMFYKKDIVKYNDGTMKSVLFYLSFAGIWMVSSIQAQSEIDLLVEIK